MKFLIILLFMILLSITITYAIMCDDVTNPKNIPCDVITPVISCANYTYDIIQVNDSSYVISNGSLNAIGDGTYNFSITFKNGDYTIHLCDGTTSTISISYDNGFQSYTLYIVAFIVLIIFILLGYKLESNVFMFMAGAISVLIAFGLYFYKFPVLNTFLIDMLTTIFAGVGFYIMIMSYFNSIVNKWGEN